MEIERKYLTVEEYESVGGSPGFVTQTGDYGMMTFIELSRTLSSGAETGNFDEPDILGY